MTKKLFILSIVILLSIRVVGQTFEFAKQFGGTGIDGGTSITTDNQGNIFMTGYFADTCWFDTTSVIANNNRNSFVAKLYPDGTVNWIKGISGQNPNSSRIICLDNYQNIYIAGLFQTSIDFGDSVIFGAGDYDGFIAKFSPEGDFKWAKAIAGTDGDDCDGLKYKNGFIYVAGYFGDTVSFGTTKLISRGLKDTYVLKMDTTGNIIWVKQAGGSWYDYGKGIDVDASNNVFLSGIFGDTANFGTFQVISHGGEDLFICKYNSNGTEQWVRQIGGSGDEQSGDLTLDQFGNIYLTARISNNFSIDANNFFGCRGLLLMKFDNNNNFHWLSQGCSTSDCGWVDLIIDNTNSLFLSGVFRDSTYLEYDTLIGNGFNPYFACFARYTVNGDLLWVVQTESSNSMYCNPYGLHSYDDSTLITTGCFSQAVDFGNITLTSLGYDDIFLAKLSKGIQSGQNEIDNPDNIFILYPNPTDQFLTIEFPNEKTKEFDLFIYNSIGSLMNTIKLPSNKNTIDIRYLPTGLYILKIQNKNYCLTKKIIKE